MAPMSLPVTKKKKMAEKKDKEARRIWKHVDIEEFQVPDSSFARPDAVKTPFQYFKRLFTDEMIQHIAHQTNLYSAQELGDPIKTNPGEIEDFLAMLLLMGVFDFPAMEDYWHPASRFNVIADNDNQQCDGSPDRFDKIRCSVSNVSSSHPPTSTVWMKSWCLIKAQGLAISANTLPINLTSGALKCSVMPVHLASSMTYCSIKGRPHSSMLI